MTESTKTQLETLESPATTLQPDALAALDAASGVFSMPSQDTSVGAASSSLAQDATERDHAHVLESHQEDDGFAYPTAIDQHENATLPASDAALRAMPLPIQPQDSAHVPTHKKGVSSTALSKVKVLRVGIVAGEVSGDMLGADLMNDLRRLHPRIEFYGVGGALMQAAGLSSLFPMTRLNHMGLVEVLKHLPDLFKAKEELLQLFEHFKIDFFVGVDAPDFNLRLAKPLKQKGVYTVQYVSPSVWAWRERRMRKIVAATHHVLCLFPFELSIYKKYKHPASCVGHPLLKKITRPRDILASRRDLVWQQAPLKERFLKRSVSQVIALLPGSRTGEIQKIAPAMFDMVKLLLAKDPNLHFLIPAVDNAKQKQIQDILKPYHTSVEHAVSVLVDNTTPDLNLQVMSASDMVVLASGTVTLEAMLLQKPMLVVYKLNALTYKLAQPLMKTKYFSLPNILANKQVVPELIQDDATPERMMQYAMDLLDEKNAQVQVKQLVQVERKLRKMSAQQASDTVLSGFMYYPIDKKNTVVVSEKSKKKPA